MTAFCEAVLSAYILDDLAALEHPHRKDQSLIMRDLRFLFRAYRYAAGKKEDWVPSSTKGGDK